MIPNNCINLLLLQLDHRLILDLNSVEGSTVN